MLGWIFGKKKTGEESGKLKLYSLRKVENKSIFKIEKRQSFLRHFRGLMNGLGFGEMETWHYDPALNREFPLLKLNNFVDTFKNKNYEIDVIFTNDRVILMAQCSDANRIKFIEGLMRFCEWRESKRKIEPLRKNF